VRNPSAEKREKEVRRDPLRFSFYPFSALELKIFKTETIMKKILLAILVISSLNAFSQADDPADGDGTVPVDGGLSLLLAAGAAYAGHRLHQKKKP
jgi:hypothetical protein